MADRGEPLVLDLHVAPGHFVYVDNAGVVSQDASVAQRVMG